jgi:DNA processing protein
MWTQPMSPTRRPGAARPSRYALPDRDNVRETSLDALLTGTRRAPKEDAQRKLLGLDEPDTRATKRVWCAGDTGLLQRASVAVVGTRNVSAAGAARARRLARELAQQGVLVVSGLARGVDTEALTAAIEAGGRVAAVIGTPLDRAYPAENARLQEEIAQHHLLISQFAPGSRTYLGHFPERNRLMAAVTDATAIIEAGDTSGTLHQAAECVRLGRWLFIAKNVMDDPALKWPANFRHYPNVRTLTDTREVLDVLS